MQSYSKPNQKRKPKKKPATSEVFEAFNILNHAWFTSQEPDPNKPFKAKSLGDIECMTIERIFKKFTASNYDPKYKLVHLGLYTVDLKHMKMYVTIDKFNSKLYL
jgi:hypothetical protein